MPARDDYYMGSLAGLDAYRGDEPAWPDARGPSILETAGPRREFGSYLEALPPRDPSLWRQAKAGAAEGLARHLALRSPLGEMGIGEEPETRALQQAYLGSVAEGVPKAQGAAGRYTREIMGGLANPSNYVGVGPVTGALWGAGSAAGSETLGHMHKGTPAEPLARFVGGLAPFGPAATKSLLQYIPEGAGAFGGRLRQPPRMSETFEPNPRATVGSNMPPEEFALKPEDFTIGSAAELPPPAARVTVHPEPPVMGETAAIVPRTWAQGLPRPQPAKRGEVPNIRDLSVPDAIAIARTQPHLIEGGGTSEGLYLGGPRDIQTKRQLNAQRRAFDEYVSADPRGGDWYDRYRRGLALSTGDVPLQNEWAAAQHGQWSAGVDPGSELHYVLKEANAALAGMPVKAGRPAPHEAHMRALAQRDPTQYQLGEKTGEYADQIDPAQLTATPGATGVNDFRYLRSWGYTEPGGEPQKGSIGEAGHRFVDMETALAVDRANRANLGGRSDWTGEQLQAAPWVRQKALDIQMRGGRNEDGSFKLSYGEAFTRANRTIADYYPQKTYNATHEAQPGADTGHLPGSVGADAAARQAYFQDPGSTWATAPLNRDAIYAGLGTPGTGNVMRVLPSEPMTGVYTPPGGVKEFNPGEIARPMGTFSTPPPVDKDFIGPHPFVPYKQATAADRAIMDAGEHFRALMDAQNAGSWHKVWEGGPANQNNSLIYPRPGGGRAALGDLFAMEGVGAPRGLPDVTDSAGGSLLTQFWPPRDYLLPEAAKDFNAALRKGEFDIPGQGEPRRVRVDSSLANLVDEWKQGEGSGAATRKVLEYVTATPELRAAFNENPYLADRALAKFERDKQWAGRWGAPRQDIQNVRQIVGAGPGWIDRIEDALRTGAISLPAVAALLAGTAALRQEDAARE